MTENAEAAPALLPSPAVFRAILSSKSVQLKAPTLTAPEEEADEIGARGAAGAVAATPAAVVDVPVAAAFRVPPKFDDCFLAIRSSMADIATTPGRVSCLSSASMGEGADAAAVCMAAGFLSSSTSPTSLAIRVLAVSARTSASRRLRLVGLLAALIKGVMSPELRLCPSSSVPSPFSSLSSSAEAESAKLDLPIRATDRRLLLLAPVRIPPPAVPALVRLEDVADLITSSLRFRAAATSGGLSSTTAVVLAVIVVAADVESLGDGVTLMAEDAAVSASRCDRALRRPPRLVGGEARSTSGADSGAT